MAQMFNTITGLSNLVRSPDTRISEKSSDVIN